MTPATLPNDQPSSQKLSARLATKHAVSAKNPLTMSDEPLATGTETGRGEGMSQQFGITQTGGMFTGEHSAARNFIFSAIFC